VSTGGIEVDGSQIESGTSVFVKVLTWAGLGLLGLIGILVAGFVIVPPATRSFTDRWGATPEEVSMEMPGDDLFDARREVSTRAVTIDAPPDLVYSLLVQMGQHRAGWYGWDWFYNLTGSSDFVDGHYSRRIVPELQDLWAGDTISINDMVQYQVVAAERPKYLVLHAGSVEPYEEPTGTWTANTMAFLIEPLPDDRSRLILRIRADSSETGFAKWVWNNPLNFGGALFARKTIVGLRRTAEEIAAER
jgi:hypothetical protein